MYNRSRFIALVLLTGTGSSWAMSPARAAAAADVVAVYESASPEIAIADLRNDGEITVTARRRVERAQDVPIALSAVSGDTIERIGATNITQFAQLTPTLVIRTNNARNPFANIRGLGSNSDQNDGLEIGVGGRGEQSRLSR